MSLPLFVYGTLLSKGSMANLLVRQRRGPAETTGTLWSLPAGYPALQLKGQGTVKGEWVQLNDERMLGPLDAYEGVAEGLYERVVIEARNGAHRFRAWAWVMADPEAHGGRRLPSGRWRSIRRR